MKAEDVVAYLQSHPDFFEDHMEMLSEITLAHPHGGRTVSLSERQMIALRERVKDLEKRLHDLMIFASENDALQAKVDQFMLSVFSADNATAITHNLRDIFAVPHVACQLWEDTPPTTEVLNFADQLSHPVCAHQALNEMKSWFGEAGVHLHSFAFLPLRNQTGSIGFLVLASEDPQRFYPEMGTLFLQRIAEIVSAALDHAD